ncbi:MAG: hypothetical protein JNL69_05110, partial [Bacteroidia bacterium]|nr:hypothetical protein [Bacteroidia bacterium]
MGDENTVTVKAGETAQVNFKPKKDAIHFISITNIDKTMEGSCTVKVNSEDPVK